ncbi:TetR/AcrR family transcriptional regulator [Pinirhizobacter sp.]|jgi:AcrR family transcriptional regulator|uniref:TetR/AcrR family transcriptional regulator n=1 Tax=Pinirhizobacter sp. TaxID=2950432 RepID=UPI002F3F332B
MASNFKASTRRQATIQAKAPRRRSIGRPAADAESIGREGLIETTCQLLRELPPNLITRAEVARRANVDPSLIRYYFNDRSSLLEAATERITAAFSRSLAKAAASRGVTAEARVRARVNAIFDLIGEYPFFQRLFVEELSDSPSHAGDKLLRKMVLEAIGDLRSVVNEGVRAGELKTTNLPFLFASMLGLAEFAATGGTVLNMATQGKLDQATAARRYRTYVGDMLVGGLRAG